MNMLDQIERIGNRLPHPAILFLAGTGAVILFSLIATIFDWAVVHPVTAEKLAATNLASSSGVWWLLSHLVENFIKFPPLAIVLVCMLGIGMAERTGLLAAVLRYAVVYIPPALLTPSILFLGIMSSIAVDAGYVVLPPLAAALYLAAGRSPLTGIAVAFAGVAGGFSANLFITATDPLLAGFTQSAATILAPDYQVAVTANWWFMIASTFVLTLTGWWITVRWIEPMCSRYPVTTATEGGMAEGKLSDPENRALRYAFIALIMTVALLLACMLIPGGPLHGEGNRFPRWIETAVPLLFLIFIIPGITFGYGVGKVRNSQDIANIMGETLAALGPYIVLAFFAAQFVESFKYSGLGEMLAISGGQALAGAQIPAPVLLGGFILLVMVTDLFIASASAKYALFAPVFVPMLMLTGFSPELTQAAYRVGDSVINMITPLNPYMISVLAFVQKYMKHAGMGTLIAIMLPYTLIFSIVWSALLVGWLLLNIPLGPAGELFFNFDTISPH